jgi:hypothetical protein
MSDGAIPLASRGEVPADVGGDTAAKPQASGGAFERTSETPDGDTGERHFGSVGGG